MHPNRTQISQQSNLTVHALFPIVSGEMQPNSKSANSYYSLTERLVKPNAAKEAKEPRSWPWQVAMVFECPFPIESATPHDAVMSELGVKLV